MFATTLDGLFTIDTKTAKCTLVASGSTYPNMLSFVPAGTLDPMDEALVGYVADTYVRINTKSGKMTMLAGSDRATRRAATSSPPGAGGPI